MRVVLDTNVIISALLYGGRPEQALRRCLEPGVALITSEHILAEVERVLHRRSNWHVQVIVGSVERLRISSEIVSASIHVTECRDPDDNRILEAAVAGRADFIVSGDADLLSMRTFRGVEILSIADFLARLTLSEGT